MSQQVRVAYLGPDTPEGPDATTFGYMAASARFGNEDDVDYINLPSHAAICTAVARQEVDCGVVAIENSVDGFIAESVRAIKNAEVDGGVRVCGEVDLPIQLFYMQKAPLNGPPKKVLSHGMGLSQCDRFLGQLTAEGIQPDVRRSTAEAAYEAARDSTVAAIASAQAERRYKLKRLVEYSVTNDKNTRTRFWVLGKRHSERTGCDKTAILVALRQDDAGALWRTLGCFEARLDDSGKLCLKEDRSRPNLLVLYPVPIAGKAWEYTFMLEFAGHIDDPKIHDGLETFADSGLSWMPAHFMGSYPDATSNNNNLG